MPATAAAADGTMAAFVFPPPLPGARMVMPRSWQVIGVHGGEAGYWSLRHVGGLAFGGWLSMIQGP